MPARKPAMRRFFRYDIAPAVRFENGLVIPYASLAEARRVSDSAFWLLCGFATRCKKVTHIGDFSSYEEAADVYSCITGCAAPANPNGLWLLKLRAHS